MRSNQCSIVQKNLTKIIAHVNAVRRSGVLECCYPYSFQFSSPFNASLFVNNRPIPQSRHGSCLRYRTLLQFVLKSVLLWCRSSHATHKIKALQIGCVMRARHQIRQVGMDHQLATERAALISMRHRRVRYDALL